MFAGVMVKIDPRFVLVEKLPLQGVIVVFQPDYFKFSALLVRTLRAINPGENDSVVYERELIV